jgi:hypothetical protein
MLVLSQGVQTETSTNADTPKCNQYDKTNINSKGRTEMYLTKITKKLIFKM